MPVVIKDKIKDKIKDTTTKLKKENIQANIQQNIQPENIKKDVKVHKTIKPKIYKSYIWTNYPLIKPDINKFAYVCDYDPITKHFYNKDHKQVIFYEEADFSSNIHLTTNYFIEVKTKNIKTQKSYEKEDLDYQFAKDLKLYVNADKLEWDKDDLKNKICLMLNKKSEVVLSNGYDTKKHYENIAKIRFMQSHPMKDNVINKQDTKE